MGESIHNPIKNIYYRRMKNNDNNDNNWNCISVCTFNKVSRKRNFLRNEFINIINFIRWTGYLHGVLIHIFLGSI